MHTPGQNSSAVTLSAEALTAGLIAASKLGAVPLMRLCLLQHAGINATDGLGLEAIHYAAMYGHVEAIELLLLHGVSEVYMKALDDDLDESACRGVKRSPALLAASTRRVYDSPLHHAVTGGHIRVVWLLLQAGYSAQDVDARGNTPMHLAAGPLCPPTVQEEMVRSLAYAGVDLEATNFLGHTVYDVARPSNRRVRDLLVDARRSVRCFGTGTPFSSQVPRFLCAVTGRWFSEDASVAQSVRAFSNLADYSVQRPVRVGAEALYRVSEAEESLAAAMWPWGRVGRPGQAEATAGQPGLFEATAAIGGSSGASTGPATTTPPAGSADEARRSPATRPGRSKPAGGGGAAGSGGEGAAGPTAEGGTAGAASAASGVAATKTTTGSGGGPRALVAGGRSMSMDAPIAEEDEEEEEEEQEGEVGPSRASRRSGRVGKEGSSEADHDDGDADADGSSEGGKSGPSAGGGDSLADSGSDWHQPGPLQRGASTIGGYPTRHKSVSQEAPWAESPWPGSPQSPHFASEDSLRLGLHAPGVEGWLPASQPELFFHAPVMEGLVNALSAAREVKADPVMVASAGELIRRLAAAAALSDAARRLGSARPLRSRDDPALLALCDASERARESGVGPLLLEAAALSLSTAVAELELASTQQATQRIPVGTHAHDADIAALGRALAIVEELGTRAATLLGTRAAWEAEVASAQAAAASAAAADAAAALLPQMTARSVPLTSRPPAEGPEASEAHSLPAVASADVPLPHWVASVSVQGCSTELRSRAAALHSRLLTESCVADEVVAANDALASAHSIFAASAGESPLQFPTPELPEAEAAAVATVAAARAAAAAAAAPAPAAADGKAKKPAPAPAAKRAGGARGGSAKEPPAPSLDWPTTSLPIDSSGRPLPSSPQTAALASLQGVIARVTAEAVRARAAGAGLLAIANAESASTSLLGEYRSLLASYVQVVDAARAAAALGAVKKTKKGK